MDGSGTSRQASVWVIVHIQDENDNKPEFPETVYRISVPERGRSKRGDPIYRVFAYDRDEGPNADLTYNIVDGNQDGKFFIDAKTAMVSSRKMVTAGSYDILTVWLYKGIYHIDILMVWVYTGIYSNEIPNIGIHRKHSYDMVTYGNLQEYTVVTFSLYSYTEERGDKKCSPCVKEEPQSTKLFC